MEDFDERGFLGIQAESFREGILKKYGEWFDLYHEINSFAQKAKFELVIHNMDGQEVICSCLYLRILDGFQSCLILARYGLVLEAEVLARSILEGLFIMRACINDEGFLREYLKSDELRRLSIMKASRKYSEWVFQATREIATEENIRELEEKRKNKEIKEVNKREASKKAGLEYLYDSIYQLLSDSVHCTARSLEDFVGTDKAGRIKRISMLPLDIKLDMVFIAAGQVMFLAMESIFKLFDLEKQKELQPLGLRFQKLVEAESR